MPKQTNRPHYIKAWAEHRNYESQAKLSEALGADKSLVSRWYNGATPSLEWQERLAEAFHCDRESLFRHPDDDWLSRFFKDREKDEVERIKQMLEIAFPAKKTG